MSVALTKTKTISLFCSITALGSALACSSADDPAPGGNGGTAPGVSGSASGGGGASSLPTGGGGAVGTAGMAGSPSTGGGGSGGGGGSSGSAAGGASGSGAGGGVTGGSPSGGSGGASTAGSGGAAGGSAGGSGSFDPCPAAGDCKVLPLGDSITFGTPSNNGGYRVKLFIDAKTDNKKLTFVGTASANGPQNVMVNGMSVPFPRSNEGYPGITIGNLDSQHISNGKAFTNKPHIVLLHIGTNDMYGGNPGGAPNALKKIIDDIAMQVPDALIAVSTIIPLSSGNGQVMTYNATIPGIVKDKAAAGKHVIFVDQYKDFPTSELTDGVHPDDSKGYPRMGDVWYAAIKQYLH
jgi:hypothetical protein